MKIAWIELESDPHRIIFVDGYLPGLEELREKLEKEGLLPEPSDLNQGYVDRIVGSFFGKNMGNYHRKASSNNKAKFHNCDLFYSKANLSGLPDSIENYEDVFNEIGKERNQNYRQLILIYDAELCQMGRGCMRNLIRKLGFQMKRPESYQNYEAFKEGISGLLNHAVLEPYEAPCIVAEERLKKTGFLANSGFY